MIPLEKSAAVTFGLNETFGVTEFEDIRDLTERPASNRAFRIVVRGSAYLLRINTRPGDMRRHFTCMQAAADAGLAPRVRYASAEDRISVTDFVEAVPLPAPDALVRIPAALRTLHALPPFPGAPFNTTCTFLLNKGPALDGFLQKFRASSILPENETEELLARYQQVAAVYSRLDSDLAPGHNDLFKPDNMLFDGNRLWLVDWEAAFQNDRYADLAVVANMIVTNESEERIYLQEYLGEPPDEYQRARFYLMRQLAHMFYAVAFLTLGSSGKPTDRSEPVPVYSDFQRHFWAREVGLADNQAKTIYGWVHWEQFSQNMRQARFDEALRIVSDRNAIQEVAARNREGRACERYTGQLLDAEERSYLVVQRNVVCSADVRLEDNSVPQHIAKTRRRQARGHKPERDTRHQVGIDKSCWKKVRALALVSAMMGIAAHAQTFTTLVNFSGPNGAIPTYESLVQGIDGNFYGTTSLGTSQNLGTVFVMNPQGQLRTLHNFDGTDGANPQAGLMAAPNGMLYGTTSYGGANGDYGTIFQITPNGTLTTLHSFSGTDGANPYAGLVQAFDGMLYGTTSRGGASGNGTIFQITPSGALTTLHSFSGTDGANAFAGLVQAANGMLYGTTTEGGAYNAGTIYAIGLSGAFTPLYSFDITDGLNPYGALVEGADGNFYGTTNRGGASVYGTVFRITATGRLTLLHSFDSTDGAQPSGGLVKGTHGDFYGTTAGGGADFYGYGTVFQIAPTGTLTTLHSFDRAGGAAPLGGLVQGTDGNFYGTTNGGGAGEYGTVFRLSMGLGPLVKTLPAFGKVGAAVKILGTDLTGATSVTFNGTPAAFTILFPTAIQTTVPSGASTGTVQVVTPSGTIASNMLFQVL